MSIAQLSAQLAHLCRLRSLTVGLVLLLSVVACSPSPSAPDSLGEEGDDTGASTPVAPPVAATPGPRVALGLSWRGGEIRSGSVLASSDDLHVDITNHTEMQQSGHLFLVASGLDGRLVRRSLESFVLPEKATHGIRIPIDRLPIQSEVSTAFVAVEAELDRGGEPPLLIPTTPLYYVFRDGYREAVIYDDHDAFTRSDATLSGQDLRDVQGRILEEDGSWVDASALAAVPGREFRQGLTRARLIPRDQVPAMNGEVAEESVSSDPDGPLAIFTRVCTGWRVAYIDSVGRGEDFMTARGWHDEPAAHTYIEITSADTGETVWEGRLNSSGCVSRSFGEGDYVLTQYSDVSLNNRQIISYQTEPFGEEDLVYMVVLQTSFTVDEFIGPYILAPTATNDAIQTVPVAGRIVAAQGTRNGLGMLAGSYTIHANEDCDPATNNLGACCKNNSADECIRVVTGRTPVGGTRGAFWKYIIAHEMGHMVQNRAMGWHFRDLNNPEPQPPEICSCDFMGPEWGEPGPSHCLQGREEIGTAQMEGFAHAFAGRVFNRTEQNNGTFVYYKEYLPPGGGSIPEEPPTRAINLMSSFFWEHTYCPAAGQAIEWDWMTFFYKIASESASSSIPFSDVYAIYRRACGNPNAPCDFGDEVGYQTLRAAALAHYGSASNARYLRFVNTANQTGIVE